MKYILTIYSKAAYAEYPLPRLGSGELPLERIGAVLPDGAHLTIGYQNGSPRFLSGLDSPREGGNRYELPLPVQDNGLYFLRPAFGGQCILALRCVQEEAALRAYRLDGTAQVSIGSLPENPLQYSVFRAISGTHALLLPCSGGHRLENRSGNGTYVNHMRVNRAWLLEPGDKIHIFGLDILYMGGYMVLDARIAGLRIHEPLASLESVLPANSAAMPEEETVLEEETVWEEETVLEDAEPAAAGEETVLEGGEQEGTVFQAAEETVFQAAEETVLQGAEETVLQRGTDWADETVFEQR